MTIFGYRLDLVQKIPRTASDWPNDCCTHLWNQPHRVHPRLAILSLTYPVLVTAVPGSGENNPG